MPKRKLFHVPFMIDEQRYLEARAKRHELKARVRSALGIPPGEIVVVTVGKVIDYKRPQDVMEIARRFRDRPAKRPVTFLMVGDGPERQAYQTTGEQEGLPVKWAGFINVDRLPEYYAAADILLHTCAIESFGLVAAEAACVGLPLVLPRGMGAIGSRGIARPNKNALLFTPGNVEEAEGQLRTLVDDIEMCAGFGAASIGAFIDNDMARSVWGAKAALKSTCG